ncbi:hypothetical protein [Paraburkholderia lacunae]|uniref:hypothetical protein n=1 Tax=Paraburkholderia lacunae TaxID=2211104 RepID=UPI001403D2F4|nr:hypothetical protein [Paraburkholderia lacunae]
MADDGCGAMGAAPAAAAEVLLPDDKSLPFEVREYMTGEGFDDSFFGGAKVNRA